MGDRRHASRALIALAAALLALLPAGAATAATAGEPGSCGYCGYDGGSQTDYSGMALTETAFGEIDTKSGTDHRSHSGNGEHWVYSAEPACRGNTASDGDAMCGTAATFCRQQKGDDAILEFISRRQYDQSGWTLLATVCIGHNDVVDPARLAQDIDIRVTDLLRLAPPTIASAPASRFLTNLPSDFWAQGPPGSQDSPKSVTVTIDDVAVTLTATATWSWRFGDETAAQASRTAGVPFEMAEDPRVDPAYYTRDGVLHTYRAAGDYRAALTATWAPSYRLTYQFGSWDDTPVVYSVAKPVTVHDAHAVLVLDGG